LATPAISKLSCTQPAVEGRFTQVDSAHVKAAPVLTQMVAPDGLLALLIPAGTYSQYERILPL
jgi:hypothetical protein